ncbi:TPA: 50S ribosomal protein L28 [Patescibacteria group bacterium]|nr:50S ribosomal protein L28 [Patescibacteria group bacterium]
MSQICQVCGKGSQTGHNVSHSKRHTPHTWKPNLGKITLKLAGGKKTVVLCTRCRKTLSKPVVTKKKKS